MQKVIHPCDVPMWDGKKYPMFSKIEFENGSLSITGVIGPNKFGNAKGSCGQIDMEFDHLNKNHNDKRYNDPIPAGELRFANGWNESTWYKFLEIWHDWHLNDMHAGCEHQDALGWTYEDHHGVYEPAEPTGDPLQDNGGVNFKFNPYKGEACPVCGYEIGSAWTVREVPQDVLDFLASLPNTDRTPAWV